MYQKKNFTAPSGLLTVIQDQKVSTHTHLNLCSGMAGRSVELSDGSMTETRALWLKTITYRKEIGRNHEQKGYGKAVYSGLR